MSREVLPVCENCWLVIYRWRPVADVAVPATRGGAAARKPAQILSAGALSAIAHVLAAGTALCQHTGVFLGRRC